MTAIAIDGPAGAGKSTVARAVAEALGYTYIDTGAMYRALALHALERGVELEDPDAVERVAVGIDLRLEGDAVTIDGRDVTSEIRTEAVTKASATIARYPGVRAALVAIQQRLAQESDVVMEGRDIGTKVLPNASVKVFLTASLDERAARRAQQDGVPTAEIDSLRTAMEARDRSDTERAESPLVQAPDAVVVDTTGRSIGSVVAEISALAREVQR